MFAKRGAPIQGPEPRSKVSFSFGKAHPNQPEKNMPNPETNEDKHQKQEILEILSGEDDLNEKNIDMICQHLSHRASKILQKKNIKTAEDKSLTYDLLKTASSALLQ